MTQILLVSEVSSLRVRAGGPATANMWLLMDGREFPAPHWNDFVVVVLGWWAEAILSLVRSTSSHETVPFMDGPYSVEVSKTSTGLLRFRALEGVGRTNEIAVSDGQVIPFVLELISQSRNILAECKRQAWWTTDAEKLESSVAVLEQAVAGLLS